jgi:hypothetical protein
VGRSPSSLSRVGDGTPQPYPRLFISLGGEDEPAASARLPRPKRDLYRIAHEGDVKPQARQGRRSSARVVSWGLDVFLAVRRVNSPAGGRNVSALPRQSRVANISRAESHHS